MLPRRMTIMHRQRTAGDHRRATAPAAAGSVRTDAVGPRLAVPVRGFTFRHPRAVVLLSASHCYRSIGS
jgi:hypothetical protein